MEEIHDGYDTVSFYFRPAIELEFHDWDDVCGREKADILDEYTERFAFMAYLAFHTRMEFAQTMMEQVECGECSNRSSSPTSGQGNQQGNEHRLEDYYPLKNLMYGFHANVESAEACLNGQNDPWCDYQREEGLANLRRVLNQFVWSCGAMAGEACYEAGLEPAHEGSGDDLHDYAYLRKVSNAFNSLIDKSLFCYVPGPFQETKWCQFFLQGDGKYFLETNLNDISKESECPLCKAHGIEPTWPGYH